MISLKIYNKTILYSTLSLLFTNIKLINIAVVVAFLVGVSVWYIQYVTCTSNWVVNKKKHTFEPMGNINSNTCFVCSLWLKELYNTSSKIFCMLHNLFIYYEEYFTRTQLTILDTQKMVYRYDLFLLSVQHTSASNVKRMKFKIHLTSRSQFLNGSYY